MTDDIVARLRMTPVLMYTDQFNQSRIDYEACKKYINNEGVKMMHDAADEIERLRRGGCARDQRTTQFCAEAVTLQREVEQLREALRIEQEELAACCIDRKETQRERDGYLYGNRMTLKALAEANEIARKYKAERDEARRMYLDEMCLRDYGDTSARIREAKARSWDCFDSDGWSDPSDECQREAL